MDTRGTPKFIASGHMFFPVLKFKETKNYEKMQTFNFL